MAETNRKIPPEIWPSFSEVAPWEQIPHYHQQRINTATATYQRVVFQDSQDPEDVMDDDID